VCPPAAPAETQFLRNELLYVPLYSVTSHFAGCRFEALQHGCGNQWRRRVRLTAPRAELMAATWVNLVNVAERVIADAGPIC
ncbi:MAG TPA: hypothetical protein VN825_05385, partial [Candidatus Acidoferrum sp.]|nr:hypothetical protein [Candidatus Acidoferrum sp.]